MFELSTYYILKGIISCPYFKSNFGFKIMKYTHLSRLMMDVNTFIINYLWVCCETQIDCWLFIFKMKSIKVYTFVLYNKVLNIFCKSQNIILHVARVNFCLKLYKKRKETFESTDLPIRQKHMYASFSLENHKYMYIHNMKYTYVRSYFVHMCKTMHIDKIEELGVKQA